MIFSISFLQILFLQLIEDMLTMLEQLGIWEVGNDWMEMERIGVRCILAFSADSNLDVRFIKFLIFVRADTFLILK